MKTTLSLFVVLLLFVACNTGPKIKLRAPEPKTAEAQSVIDTLKTDTSKKINLAN